MSTLPVVVTARNTSGLTTTGNAVININDAAAPPVFRAVASVAYGSRTNTTVNKPAGTVDGDIMIWEQFVGRASSSPAVTFPTGWAQVMPPTTITDTSGFVGWLYTYWKRASSEATTYTLTHAAASTQAAIASYSGCVATGSPIGATSSATAATGAVVSPTTTNAPSITTTAVNSRVLFVQHGWDAAASTPPAGMTERFEGLIYLADYVAASPGATGSKVGNATYAPWAAGLIELKAGEPAPLQAPVVTNGNFSVATGAGTVGAMSATNNPTSWAITAGNAAGYFSISNAGVISTTAAVVAGSYSLTVSATNAAGSGTGTASIVAAAVGARPGPTNTGYVNAPGYPGSLTAAPATIQSNTTYSFRSFNGGAFIGSAASPVSNVTFYGCRFRATGDVNVALFGDNITFEYCTFEPTNVTSPPVAYNQGYQYGIVAGGPYNAFVQKLTVQNCNIWGFGNAIDVFGSTQAKPQVFRNNWIHDPRADGGIDHTDGLGSYSGGGTSRYVVIDNNVIEGVGNTNALGFQSGTWTDFTITNNLFGGFGYTLSIYANVSNLTFTDNVFSTQYPTVFGPMREGLASYPGSLWRRNRWYHPPGAAWGNAAHDGRYWMPVAGSSQNSATFTSLTDYGT
jgi:hypothetical protein